MPEWVSTIIGMAIPLILAILGVVAKKYHKKMSFEDKQNKSSVLHYAVTILVKAAEQIWDEKGQGGQRKKYVKDNVRKFVEKLGVRYLDSYDDIIDSLIEATVLQLPKKVIKN